MTAPDAVSPRSSARCSSPLRAPSAVAAHDPSPIFEGDGLWAQDADLTFDWSDTGWRPFDMRVAIKDGAADQNASRGVRAATFRALDGSRNLVDVRRPRWSAGPAALRACGATRPPASGLWFRENGHRFDSGHAQLVPAL